MTGASCPGVIVAAPASGSGKTVVTLGLLRALSRAGYRVASVKVGPDYIDPAFHEAATGRPCRNLDPWAMQPATIARLWRRTAAGAELIVAEGVMGLFDGAIGGGGSTADLAALTGWPVVLVVDVHGQAASAAAVVRGFRDHRVDIRIAGTVLNRVAGERHAAMIRTAMAEALPDVGLLGAVPRDPALALPDRHLGLVQAREHGNLDGFLDGAADVMAAHIDLPALAALAGGSAPPKAGRAASVFPPLGQRIALARDEAFAFAYPGLLEDWREAGAEICPFSPLADEAPDAAADAVYLPGGYPELHAGRLAAAQRFRAGLEDAAARGAFVFGECGGYMMLGDGLVDGDGARHAMAGLLPLETSFAEPRLHLGYRRLTALAETPLGSAGARYAGHEFHYAATLSEGDAPRLFAAADAAGEARGPAGTIVGTVAGSFMHLIDRAP